MLTQGREGQTAVGAVGVHAVELRSCHVYTAHDQRRTHVALVPLRGEGVVSSKQLDHDLTLDPGPAPSYGLTSQD